VLVRPVLLCSGGDVRPVLVAVRIWGVAPPLVHHPCVGGCWIRRLVVVLAVGLVVVESLSSLGQALFRSFSRQIWQPSRWRCDVSLRWWQWCSMVECFSLQCAMESSLWRRGRGAQGPFGAAVLRASMVEGSRRASWAGGGDHLSRVAVPRCSNHHGGGCEGRECFCDGGFVSGMDSFGGPCGSWLWKA
jgi:hypothetical protein